MHALDYPALKRGLNASAHTYTSEAALFNNIQTLLIERLSFLKLNPDRILDLGSGTGQCSRPLLKLFPQARIYSLDLAEARLKIAKGTRKWFRQQHYIAGDMHTLPLKSNSIDLIISNLTWHWSEHLHQAIYEAKRVLKVGGTLLFTVFGPDTLRELRASFASFSENPHIHSFLDMHDIGDALLKAGFTDPVMDVEHQVYQAKSVMQILKVLQSLGETNYQSMRARGLFGKKLLSALNTHYQTFEQNGHFPATVEVVFGYARRDDTSLTPVETNGDIAIPITEIKRPSATLL